MIHVGFTGTQSGLTDRQRHALAAWVRKHAGKFEAGRHGDCVGADEAFDRLLEQVGKMTVIHPPDIAAKRAFCARREGRISAVHPVVELAPLPYLERNHAIVDACHRMLAAPNEMTEQLRSGTWATVRYARKLRRTIRFFWPNGTTTMEFA